MTKKKIIEASNLTKKFKVGQDELVVINNLTISLHLGDSLSIVGPSGSGKSTLLHLLGGLDVPDQGEIKIDGKLINNQPDKDRTKFRNQKIGFVYQFHHLLPEFSVVENVAMPLIIRRYKYKDACAKARVILKKMGLENRYNYYPSMLSGGERQRTAIARSLVTDPCIVLADEPTGNLDKENAMNVFKMLMQRVGESDASLIIVTHDFSLASKCDNSINLELQ